MRVLRMLVALLVTMPVMWMAATDAHAEDPFLDSSDPAPHQELSEVPGWVTLVFKAKSDASVAVIFVVDTHGAKVNTGPLVVEGTNVTTQLKADLPKGTYTVYYRTSDKAGQPRGGAFQFSYGPGTWTPVGSEVWVGASAEPTVISATGSPVPSPDPTATAAPSDAPSSSPATPAANSGNPILPWAIVGGVVVLAAIGGAVWWSRRRKA